MYRDKTGLIMDPSYLLPIIQGLLMTNTMQDWRQTRHIANQPDRYIEKNRQIGDGDHPSKEQVNRYMGRKMALNMGSYYAMPDWFNYAVLPAVLVDTAMNVENNKKIGLGGSGRINSLGAALTGALLLQKYNEKNGNHNISVGDVGGGPGLVYQYRW